LGFVASTEIVSLSLDVGQSNNRRTALVIDDEPEIAEFVADVLELCDFDVVHVSDSEAVHRCDPADFTMVVLDLVMPGEDGVALLPHFANTTHPPDLILMSGEVVGTLEEAQTKAEALGLKVRGFLRKPFFAADLEALIGCA
jgi:CheY-like chemotaxis protein